MSDILSEGTEGCLAKARRKLEFRKKWSAKHSAQEARILEGLKEFCESRVFDRIIPFAPFLRMMVFGPNEELRERSQGNASDF